MGEFCNKNFQRSFGALEWDCLIEQHLVMQKMNWQDCIALEPWEAVACSFYEAVG